MKIIAVSCLRRSWATRSSTAASTVTSRPVVASSITSKSGFAHQAKRFAVGQREADIGNDVDAPRPNDIGNADIPQFQNGAIWRAVFDGSCHDDLQSLRLISRSPSASRLKPTTSDEIAKAGYKDMCG